MPHIIPVEFSSIALFGRAGSSEVNNVDDCEIYEQ